MFNPVKKAYGEYLGRFYQSLIPTNAAVKRFCDRGLGKSIAWAPARMIDKAEEMLSAWVRNDTHDAPSKAMDLPVIIVAMGKERIPTGRDFSRQVADSVWVTIPDDPKNRAFQVKTTVHDIRTQLAFFAHDESTAGSLAAQYTLFLDSVENRRFFVTYRFAGQNMQWPVQVETPEVQAIDVPTDAKNLTILTVDVTLKSTMPWFNAPSDNEANDGKGEVGNADDPSGYPVVSVVDSVEHF